MSKRKSKKKVSDNTDALNKLLASLKSNRITVWKPGKGKYPSLLADWKKRLKITKDFYRRVLSFDYNLLEFNESFYEKEYIRDSLSSAKDSMVVIFCYEKEESDPEFILILDEKKLLNKEIYQKIFLLFDFIIVDYKESGFDYLLTSENEAWIIRF